MTVAVICLVAAIEGRAAAPALNLRFRISFPASVHAQPITGRVFVMVSRKAAPEPRLQVGFWQDPPPLFAADVNQLRPGVKVAIDARTLGFPPRSLRELAVGDYYVQALINVYTQFHRADGHVIWAHMDQWEGQQFNSSPGNLYSDTRKVRLDPKTGYNVDIALTKVIPPVNVPPDTAWVKRIKIESKLLTRFWGHPMYLGATVLLPKDYDAHPDAIYPVVYQQDHFSLEAPFYFSDNRASGIRRYEFYEAWDSGSFPRMIAVNFLHPTPYFDDSYAVNSASNGPYGDAILTELIPYRNDEGWVLLRLAAGRGRRRLRRGSKCDVAVEPHADQRSGGERRLFAFGEQVRGHDSRDATRDPAGDAACCGTGSRRSRNHRHLFGSVGTAALELAFGAHISPASPGVREDLGERTLDRQFLAVRQLDRIEDDGQIAALAAMRRGLDFADMTVDAQAFRQDVLVLDVDRVKQRGHDTVADLRTPRVDGGVELQLELGALGYGDLARVVSRIGRRGVGLLRRTERRRPRRQQAPRKCLSKPSPHSNSQGSGI